MNRISLHTLTIVACVTVASSLTAAKVGAQIAGGTVLGLATAEWGEVAEGWSARRQILGSTVYNDKKEKVGQIDDIIVSPGKAVSYAIIGAGGFLGVDRHDVAIPVSQFTQKNGEFVLAGATKDAIKAMPQFEYAPK
jgi:hypothetical protein